MTGLLLTILVIGQLELPAGAWPRPESNPEIIGPDCVPPIKEGVRPAEDVSIGAWSDDVLPDQSFVLTGRGLGDAELALWGPSATKGDGQHWPARVVSRSASMVLATVSPSAPAGVYVVWPGRQGHWGAPVRLNAPEIWWCTPDRVSPGETLRICGRNLARKPDHIFSSVYLEGTRGNSQWIPSKQVDKYFVDVEVPEGMPSGHYQVWVHAGDGGAYGWSNPVPVTIRKAIEPKAVRTWEGRDEESLEKLLEEIRQAGGGIADIPPGTFILHRPLQIPEGVRLRGDAEQGTIFQYSGGKSAAGSDAKANELSAAVYLRGNHCGLESLTILGDCTVHWGVVAEPTDKTGWLTDVQISDVAVADIDGRGGEAGAIRLVRVDRVRVENCELHGRAPLFFSGVRHAWVAGNHLLPASRFGGGAEGAILSRTEPLSQCVIENNKVVCPMAGTPQVRRLIWVSTGRGSVHDNLFLGNSVDNARFSGVPGTDQNVGETILFESRMRYAFYGSPRAVDAQSITLPADAPFLPPTDDGETTEPAVSEYYAVVLDGNGQGQVRRVAGRDDRQLRLDQPWRIVPQAQDKILVSTLFARNLVLENHAADGMSGIQLWIGGWQNVIARNQIARQRRQGIYLYSATTSLAPQMPPTWNRGIGPLWFNTVEENMIVNCAEGIVVNANNNKEPVQWPRAAGTVVRRNTIEECRFEGITCRTSGSSSAPAVAGTIVEFNQLRDQPAGICAGKETQDTLIRRNLIYVWNPYLLDHKPVGLRVEGVRVTAEANDVEGSRGESKPKDVEGVQRSAESKER
jgi:hypothetical protein